MAETKNTVVEEVKDTTPKTETPKVETPKPSVVTPAKKTGKVIAKGNGKIYVAVGKYGYCVDAKGYGDVKMGQEIQF